MDRYEQSQSFSHAILCAGYYKCMDFVMGAFPREIALVPKNMSAAGYDALHRFLTGLSRSVQHIYHI